MGQGDRWIVVVLLAAPTPGSHELDDLVRRLDAAVVQARASDPALPPATRSAALDALAADVTSSWRDGLDTTVDEAAAGRLGCDTFALALWRHGSGVLPTPDEVRARASVRTTSSSEPWTLLLRARPLEYGLAIGTFHHELWSVVPLCVHTAPR